MRFSEKTLGRVVGNKALEANAVEVASTAGIFAAEFDTAYSTECTAAFTVEKGVQAGKLVEEYEGAVLAQASGIGVGKGFRRTNTYQFVYCSPE